MSHEKFFKLIPKILSVKLNLCMCIKVFVKFDFTVKSFFNLKNMRRLKLILDSYFVLSFYSISDIHIFIKNKIIKEYIWMKITLKHNKIMNFILA